MSLWQSAILITLITIVTTIATTWSTTWDIRCARTSAFTRFVPLLLACTATLHDRIRNICLAHRIVTFASALHTEHIFGPLHGMVRGYCGRHDHRLHRTSRRAKQPIRIFQRPVGPASRRGDVCRRTDGAKRARRGSRRLRRSIGTSCTERFRRTARSGDAGRCNARMNLDEPNFDNLCSQFEQDQGPAVLKANGNGPPSRKPQLASFIISRLRRRMDL